MKIKSILSIVLSLLLVCLFATAAMAADVNNTTIAKIAFEDGDLEFITDPEDFGAGMGNMDLDFGTHTVSIEDQTYIADDFPGSSLTSHTLRVSDARNLTGVWDLTVKLGLFEYSSDEPFKGDITLTGGVPEIYGNTGTLKVESPIVIAGGDTSGVQVADATTMANRGKFDMTWQSEKIELYILAEEMDKVVDGGVYTADMVWTLTTA